MRLMRLMRRLVDVREPRVALALALTCPACHVEHVALDPNPPGLATLGADSGTVGACTSTPAALAKLPGTIQPMLVMDLYNLYTVTDATEAGPGAQSLWRVPKDASQPLLLTTSASPITSLCVAGDPSSASGVYWTSADDPESDAGPSGGVWRSRIQPGPPSSIAANRSAPTAVTATVLPTAGVYWAEPSTNVSGNQTEAIVTTPEAGGPVTTVLQVPAAEAPGAMGTTLWAPAGSLVWTTWSPSLDNQVSAEIVIASLSDAGLTRLGGLGGGGAMSLQVPTVGVPQFSSAESIETIWNVEGAGFELETLAVTGGYVQAFAATTGSVYFVQPLTNELVSSTNGIIGNASGVTSNLAGGVSPSSPLQADSACVYWIDVATGEVDMVAE